jgi:hypothetical protein
MIYKVIEQKTEEKNQRLAADRQIFRKSKATNLESSSPSSDQAVERNPDVFIEHLTMTLGRIIIAHDAVEMRVTQSHKSISIRPPAGRGGGMLEKKLTS